MSAVRHPCASIEEAVVLRGLLNANGVEAELDNYFHAQNDWFLVQALGGVGIIFPKIQIIDALDIIQYAKAASNNHLHNHFGNLDDAPHRPRRIKAWSMPFIFFGIPNLVIILLLLGIMKVTESGAAPQLQPTWQNYTSDDLFEINPKQDCGYYGCKTKEPPSRPPLPRLPSPPPTHYAAGRSHSFPDLFGLFAYIMLANAFANFSRQDRKSVV